MIEPEKIMYDLMCCLVLGGNESEKHEAMRNALMCINQLEQDNERAMYRYDAAMCEAADSAAMVQRWICVKDQMPEVRESVAIIVRDEDDEYLRIGWINSQREWHTVGGCVGGTVTQWLRIPDWPEGMMELIKAGLAVFGAMFALGVVLILAAMGFEENEKEDSEDE